MNIISPEKYIDKPIAIIQKEKIGGILSSAQSGLYTVMQKDDLYYMLHKVRTWHFNTDKKGTINRLAFTFSTLFSEEDLERVVMEYGKPSHCFALDTKMNDTTKEYSEGKQKLRKREYTTKQVTMENNPLFVIWEKEEYTIEVLRKVKSNTTHITFRTNNINHS